MRKLYPILIASFIVLFSTTNSNAQNNLAAGDVAIVSYQSDPDATNATTDFNDRFSIVILKNGGLAAGTVLFITDNGWSTTTSDFIASNEGFLKWTVPAGGVAQGAEVYFISFLTTSGGHNQDEWRAYSDEAGTTLFGTLTLESGANVMALSAAGDQVIIYQTGPTGGPAGAYNATPRRFITAVHANLEASVTTYTAWDGSGAAGGNQSALPPGLTSGAGSGNTAAVLYNGTLPDAAIIANTEPDDAKYNCTGSTSCSVLGLSNSINSGANWTFSQVVFTAGNTTSHCTYTINTPVNIGTQPSNATLCSGLPVSFTVAATGTGTLTYQWQESADAGFTSPTTLSNTGVYSGVTTTTLSISNDSALGGKFYRAVVTGTCGAVNSNGASLTVTSPSLSGNNTVTQSVTNANNNFYGASCAIIAKVVPSGASPVSGSVTTQVWVEGAVPTYSGQPFVQRHYQITPATNPSTATATVTLYFSQAEFTAFNSAPGSTLDLPTGPGDNTGKANLRVAKYSGSSSNSTGLPGTYSGGVTVIDPPDASIFWNATFSRWEVTVDVTGFSGFIVQTAQVVLPVDLTSFSAQLNNNDVLLKWQTASELNHDYFEVERSVDGRNFVAVGRLPASSGNGVRNYSLTDAGAALLNTSKIYYRLKMVSLAGNVDYSHTVIAYISKKGFVAEVLPNPFADKLNVSLNAPKSGMVTLNVSDVSGRVLIRQQIPVVKGFSTYPVQHVDKLSRGVYVLTMSFENEKIITTKIIK